MNDKDIQSVPFVVYEASQARSERRDKRFIIALIIVTAMLFISNLVWVYAWTSYDYSSQESVVTVDSEDGGNASYIGHDGDINNGTSDSSTENQNED